MIIQRVNILTLNGLEIIPINEDAEILKVGMFNNEPTIWYKTKSKNFNLKQISIKVVKSGYEFEEEEGYKYWESFEINNGIDFYSISIFIKE